MIPGEVMKAAPDFSSQLTADGRSSERVVQEAKEASDLLEGRALRAARCSCGRYSGATAP